MVSSILHNQKKHEWNFVQDNFQNMNWDMNGKSKKLMNYHVFEGGFLEGSCSLNWPSNILKDNWAFQLCTDTLIVLIRVTFCELGAILLVKFFR